MCTGNVCRSPMAEGIFRALAKEKKDLEARSAGLSAPEGEPPSANSIKVLHRRGIDISELRSRQLTPQLVQQATHIFSMTLGHKAAIEALYPAATEKSFLLREFVDGAALDQIEEGLLDVPDPIGLELDAYETTHELIMEAMPGILRFLEETRNTGTSLE